MLNVTIVASPSTDKLIKDALSDDTLDVENTNSLLVAGPQMDCIKDIIVYVYI